MLADKFPILDAMLTDAAEDALAFSALPHAHWPKTFVELAAHVRRVGLCEPSTPDLHHPVGLKQPRGHQVAD